MKEIRVNLHAEIRRETISGDQYCVIVDDFLRDPHELVETAAHHADEFEMPERPSYPGRLIRVDCDPMKDIYRFIRFKMTKHFPFLKGDMKLSTFLSMVTFRPDELSTLQRLCHTDPTPSPDRTPYAALVYLFENEDLGGTGFYRWKALELMKQAQVIENEDPDKGRAFLQENLPTYRQPARYMTGSNEIAELLCTIPARFNRMIFYSGKVPHSGDITAPELLSIDPRKGRLTLNVFIDAVPK
ncbi:MAG: hypothetical protein IIA07_13530 [Proteobacteria bacterium]|nr:hypothetical protein [Pseudomonadota bacterium]